MSKIILVEPYKMLQHAFVVALLPDHDVRIVENLRAAEAAAAEADLAIVDVAALRSRKSGSADELFTQSWNLPTIWIDNDQPNSTPASTFTCLRSGLTKEDLRAAVGGLLRAAAEPAAKAGSVQSSSPASKAKAPKTKRARRSDDKTIIELVDVFEESDEGDEQAEASSRE